MVSETTSTALEEPIPVEEEAPAERLPPGEWVRSNLFNNWFNSLLTVVFGLLLAYAAYRAARFVFVTARWTIIEENLANFMLGRFPRGEVYRVWLALGIGGLVGGVGLGAAGRDRVPSARRFAGLRMAAPALVGLGAVLSFTRSPTPALLVLAVAAVGVVGWLIGRRLPQRARRRLPLVYLAGVLLAYAAMTAFGGVGWDEWGGLLLTVFAAAAGILLAFPFGLLLALGRRSSFPGIRLVCVVYIELIRGVPLYTLLLIGAVVIGLFLPPGASRPTLVTRALIAIVLFTAAYVAEIVRGGLQSVPKGQVEAGQSLGLSPVAITRRIVLPQALRAVIPALVGQFISLYKDTSLLATIGLIELLGVALVVTSQGQFLGQGLQAETLVFASFLFWVACYSMSRASQRLEKRLGVGER